MIRRGRAGDVNAFRRLYPAAFPDEDLIPLVSELLPRSDTLSLVAAIDEQVVGNVIFTMCGVEGSDISAALLGPLAVSPTVQRQGVGSRLVRAGLQQLQDVDGVLVLGDPAYYGRFGFAPERSITTPFAIPPEWLDAWQSQAPGDSGAAPVGKLLVPGPWKDPSLWAP